MADCFLTKRGQSKNIEYGENIFDFENFKSVLSSIESAGYQAVINGTIKWIDNGFTITATADDCYTNVAPSVGTPPLISVEESTFYELSYDVNGDSGKNYVFFDYPINVPRIVLVYNQVDRIIFPTLQDTTKIVLRFGVDNKGNICTFKNIKLRKILNM